MNRAGRPESDGAPAGDGTGSPTTRRRALAAAAAGVATLAGCSGLVSDPDPEPTADAQGADGTATDSQDSLSLETIAVGGSPGETVSLRPTDRPVLLDFFATWCAPCIPQMETLRTVRSTFAPADLRMVSVTSEADEAAVREFWQQHDGAWPVATDPRSRAVREYSVTGVPTLLVVRPDGTVTWRHTGLAGRDTLLGAVRRALG